MLQDIIDLDKKYYMNTFGDRLPVCFERGEGIKLYTEDGKEYYDFLGGIAVNALGHCHPKLTEALKEQLDRLIHTSSLYYIENQARLAEQLACRTCADRVFLCNSGAEANEGAIKLARIYNYKKGLDRYEVISLDKSFHGRTVATVAATGQEKYQAPYRAFTNGFKQVEPNNIEALKAAVTDKTAAVMLELIQGESGVYPLDEEYVRQVRRICDEKDIVLIFDEVQTGMGRTGYLFAHQKYGIYPDVFTCAKALGGGIPIGAVCAVERVASAFEPGDHGTTFGGNPFASAAGLAVFKIYDDEDIINHANVMGEYFEKRLKALWEKYPEKIADVRCAGLLIGIEVKPDMGKAVFDGLFKRGILTSLCGGKTIRIAPPLILKELDIELFVSELESVLKGID